MRDRDNQANVAKNTANCSVNAMQNTYISKPASSSSDDRMIERYPCIDGKTWRRYKKVPVHASGVRKGETGKNGEVNYLLWVSIGNIHQTNLMN